ncbi:MAG: 50S ribosomal protein L18 [Saprospiraceae bacterium]|jgi:large subunit ribosomal protein L18
MKFKKEFRRRKIHWRIRRKVAGTATKPRLNVYRSNKEIYCQLVDDVNGFTLAGATSLSSKLKGTKTEKAREVGKLIAEKAKALNIETVVFDRGGYLYHGRVKALAEGAREGGLKF